MTPVAVFAHRRAEHLRATLAALGDCRRLDECAVTIFCDGPRSDAEHEAVASTRAVARGWAAAHSATVIERDENRGLAASIVGAVTELCATHGRAVVVEDDLIVSPGFLDFMLTALDRYADAPEVLQVSGYMFPVEHPPQPDAFLLPLGTTWGWATWQRAWSAARLEIDALPTQLADPATRRRFNLDDSYDYAAMLEARVAGRNQSWGVLWQWHLFSIGGLALHPRRSLVKNIGFDDTATHRGAQPFATDAQRLWSPDGPLQLPAEIAADDTAFDRIKALLAAGKSRPKRRLRFPFLKR